MAANRRSPKSPHKSPRRPPQNSPHKHRPQKVPRKSFPPSPPPRFASPKHSTPSASEILGESEKREQQESEERQRVQLERQEVERELRRLSNERRQIDYQASVEKRNREAMTAILAVVGATILVGVIIAVIVAWRRSRQAKDLNAQSSAPGGLIQQSQIGDAGSLAMNEKKPPQAFLQYQYQAQPAYSMMPSSPIDEKTSVFSPSPSYEDAPPAYTIGS